MATYYVAANLNHDGREYKPGDTVQLSQEAASPLLAAEVISTDPTLAAAVPEAPVEEQRQPEPEVGGKEVDTGEPSIDGPENESSDNEEAKDVTLGKSADLTPENEEDISKDL